MGGAIFIENGGILNIEGTISFSGNAVTSLTGSQHLGADIFMQNGSTLNFTNLTASLTSFSGPIQSENNTNTSGGITIARSSPTSVNFTGLANTYTGTTTIGAGGTLIIDSDGCLGTGGAAASNPLVMDASTGNPTLEIAGTVTLATARGLTFSGSGTSTFKIDAGHSLAYTGNLALGTGSLTVNTVGASSTCSLSGAISGSGLTISGVGTLTLSGASANTYSGTTTISGGMLQLDKSSNIVAIPGNISLTGGTLLLQASNQIANSSNMTLGGTGTFNVATFNTTLNSLTYDTGGTFTTGGGTLSLASATSSPAALTMQGGTTIGSVTLSSGTTSYVVFDDTNNGTATISGTLNLGGGTTTFNIAAGSGSPDMNISGIISTGSINLSGLAGILEFSGTSANTYSGTTTLSTGTLQLGKSQGIAAIPGDIALNGGTLQLLVNDQFAHTGNMTLGGGTFNMNGFNATLNSLTYNSGTLTQIASETLSLASGVSSPAALTMQGGTSIGSVTLSSGTTSFVAFTTGSGIATIGNLNLGGGTATFDIGSGLEMNISGVISNGNINLSELAGTLEFTGASANTYAGTTTLTTGTLLLNKSTGVASLPGTVIVTGGTLTQQASGQLVNTSNVTVGGTGIFHMGGFNTTLNSLTFNTGGTFDTGGGTLSLASATSSPAALTMQGSTTIGSVTLSSGTTAFLVFDPTNNGTATITGTLNLGGGNTTFNIGHGTGSSISPDMIVSGAITGGTISLSGLGFLEFSGSTSNSYSGTTTLNSGFGTLLLNKTSAFAIPGDITLNGGTLEPLAANQIVNTSNMTLGGGTFDMGFATTLGSLTYNSGILTQGGATLTLANSSPSTALTMQGGTTISGPIVLSHSGAVALSGTSELPSLEAHLI